MDSRYFSPTRKIALTSIALALIVALLSGGIQSAVRYRKRTAQFDTLVNELRGYLNVYFSELLVTIDTLQPLSRSSCGEVASELTSRGAFSPNVRAFLLIKDRHAFCSSATGAMDLPLKQLAADLDPTQKIDMTILGGTPMIPGQPVFALWVRNSSDASRGVFVSINTSLMPWLLYTARQNQTEGIALVVKNLAISTFDRQPIRPERLAVRPIREAKIDNLPLKIYLYGANRTLEILLYALLTGGLSGLLCGLLCFYLLSTRLHPGQQIQAAIRRKQFYLVYQPVVEACDMRICGVEVLLRWRHPQAGEIPPDSFIRFAESQKLIVPLTRHLFDLIVADAPTLQRLLPPHARLGINIAPGHLHADSFRDDLRRFAARLPTDALKLTLEITERDMIDQAEAGKLFDWLRRQGFAIAIDDFGTGHSALIYLQRFTFDYLKIDRGFINAIGRQTLTSPVLDAVLDLANRLSLATVAEGVETPEQVAWLRARGVDFLQGYWISRPLTLEQLIAAHDEPANYFTIG